MQPYTLPWPTIFKGDEMSTTQSQGIYEELGIKRVVNTFGNLTLLGGSTLSPRVWAAMEEANERFVSMEELLKKSGEAVAQILGAEAALVTSGAFAALVLGAAAIITGKDDKKIAQLPDTTGMKNEFLIQKRMRYHYDRSVTVPGPKLVEVGDEEKTTAEQMEAAIRPRTAGILYLARADGTEGVLPLSQVIGIARKKGVAVLVDAAAEVYPLQRMTGLAGGKADLVCFGAKYFSSAHSTGILCGRKELVEAAVLNNFIAYEAQDNHCIGRGYKVDRQEVIGTLAALREWFTMNHEERFRIQEERIGAIANGLVGIPHVKAERVWERNGPWMRLCVTLDEGPLGKTAASVGEALREGDPSIWVRVEGNQIHVAAHNLQEGEDRLVAGRLRQLLTA
jgi:L-seryl-tRNA(Ser) seleniumtransferase